MYEFTPGNTADSAEHRSNQEVVTAQPKTRRLNGALAHLVATNRFSNLVTSYADSIIFRGLVTSMEIKMKKESFALAGLTLGGAGLFLGMAMSSSIPSTPIVYGVASALYAAIAAGVFAGVRRRRLDMASDYE